MDIECIHFFKEHQFENVLPRKKNVSWVIFLALNTNVLNILLNVPKTTKILAKMYIDTKYNHV